MPNEGAKPWRWQSRHKSSMQSFPRIHSSSPISAMMKSKAWEQNVIVSLTCPRYSRACPSTEHSTSLALPLAPPSRYKPWLPRSTCQILCPLRTVLPATRPRRYSPFLNVCVPSFTAPPFGPASSVSAK